MTEFRKQLETLRSAHLEQRYRGDLAADVMLREAYSNNKWRFFVSGGALGAAVAAMVAMVLWNGQPEVNIDINGAWRNLAVVTGLEGAVASAPSPALALPSLRRFPSDARMPSLRQFEAPPIPTAPPWFTNTATASAADHFEEGV